MRSRSVERFRRRPAETQRKELERLLRECARTEFGRRYGFGEIRTPEISMYASGVSAQPCVRAFLLDMQRQLARTHNVVMDGRDIGTVVLPKADVKIFLTASAEVRAKRRFDELQQKGDKTPYAQILAETKQRDKQDSERTIAPLKQAADAVLLDTSDDTVKQSVDAILAIVRRKLG